VLNNLPARDGAIGIGQIGLGLVQLAEQDADLVHAGAPFRDAGAEAVVVGAGDGLPPPPEILVILTAVTFYRGCFDTGSHSVLVSSLAAVGA
jgi:hypothetical protein